MKSKAIKFAVAITMLASSAAVFAANMDCCGDLACCLRMLTCCL